MVAIQWGVLDNTSLSKQQNCYTPFIIVESMSKICQITGKRPMTGNNVSHSKRRTKRRFMPNLQSHRFWVESENRWIKLKISTKGMRIIDKNGIDSVLADLRKKGVKI